MEFPKRVMRIKELKKIGYPEQILMRAYRDPKQDFAVKIDPLKKNSPIVFDTAGFEKWILREIKLQKRS